MSRRYKTHLRDFLSTCRSKRSYSNITDPTYNNYNNVYSATTYATDNTTSLYMNPQNLGSLQNLYPASYIPTDNLFHYRQLGSYYPDYMSPHSYVGNGYMDTTRPCLSYESPALSKTPTTEQKFYCSSQLDGGSKYTAQYYTSAGGIGAPDSNTTVLPPLEHKYDLRTPPAELRREHTPLLPPSPASTAPPPSVPPPSSASLTPTTDGPKDLYTNDTRQTVLMWGSGGEAHYEPIISSSSIASKKYSDSPIHNSSTSSSTSDSNSSSHITSSSSSSSTNNNNSNNSTPLVEYSGSAVSTISTPSEGNSVVHDAIPGAACKWGPPTVGTPGARSNSGGSPHEGASPPGSAGGKVGYYTTTETGGDVWTPHQYYHYHHPYHTTTQ